MIRYLFVSLLACGALFSCSKKSDPDRTNCDTVVRLQRLSLSPKDVDSVILYDNEGRVKQFINRSGRPNLLFYYKDKVQQAAEIADNPSSYLLDANGRVNTKLGEDNQYTYNADGHLISFRKLMSLTGTPVYEQYTLSYENGNLVEVKYGSPLTSLCKFTYHNEPNQPLAGVDPLSRAGAANGRIEQHLTVAGYFGKLSKNLLKTYEYQEFPGVIEVPYNKDTRGRIVSIDGEYSYTYQCP